jgi:cyanophycinase
VGKLLLIGGNEDRTGEMDVLRAFVAEAGGAKGRIEVITTASAEPIERWIEYKRAFGKIGIAYAAPMHIGSSESPSPPRCSFPGGTSSASRPFSARHR